MFFFYRKSFDISRTRAGNTPRLANVNLSTFGQWGVCQTQEDAPGYICTSDVDAGLKDLISYGLEELKKVEFPEIQDGEIINFQRGLVTEIRNVTERMVSLLNNEVALASLRTHQASIARVAARDLTGFDANTVGCNVISNLGSFKDFGNTVVRTMSAHQRRQVPREFIGTERLYMTRPAIGGTSLTGANGFLNFTVQSAGVSFSMGSLTETGDYTLSSPQVTVDYNQVNRRYVRYLQYLAHTYSPFRLRVTESQRDQCIYIQLVIDFGFVVDQYFELYRPYMPECTIANPTMSQKALLSMLVASQFMMELEERRQVPDECFAAPTVESVTQALGVRLSTNIVLPSFKPGEELLKYSQSITEALWSLSKLRGSILPSTSLDFPELTQFLQPTSAA